MTRRDLGTALSVFGIFIVLGLAVEFSGFYHGEPFRLVLRPNGEGTTIRFEHPEFERVSPAFTVDRRLVEQPMEIVLDDGDVEIPGGNVDFHDVTVLPGRFTIRIDGVVYDVMSSRIEVDGTITDWQRAK